jgi:hypothetical protein
MVGSYYTVGLESERWIGLNLDYTQQNHAYFNANR